MPTPLILVLGLLAAILIFRNRLQADWRLFKTDRRKWLHQKWEDWVKPLFVAAILALAIRTYLLGPYKIPTGSMRPILMEGDRIFVDKISY